MPISVAIVEDNAEVSYSLERLLAESGECRTISVSRSGEGALRTISRQPPDVVIMDIELPGLSGIECTARLKRLVPQARILILTVYHDHEKIFRALEAGASGYLLKRSSGEEILRAIREVKEGGAAMSAEIAAKVVQSFYRPAPVPVETLTRREEEILQLLARGLVAKEIAAKLSISYETVRGHLANVYEKLHVRSRTEAVIKYLGVTAEKPPN